MYSYCFAVGVVIKKKINVYSPKQLRVLLCVLIINKINYN